MTQKIIGILGLASLAVLSGCNTTSSPRVVLPSTPPLAADILEQVASSCQKDIERLKSRNPYVPMERKKEYETVLKLAEKDCSELQKTLAQLKGATHCEQSLRQNIQHTEATMLPGTLVSEPNAKMDPSQKTSGEISMEPLR